MTKSFGTVLFLAIMVTLSCNKSPDVIFELPIQISFEIRPGLSPFERHFYLVKDVPTNFGPLSNQFQLGEDSNPFIRPGSAVLSSLLRNIDLNFVQEIEVSVYEDDPDDDFALFYTAEVPGNAGKNVLVLPFDRDASEFLTRESLNFRIAMRYRAITPTAIESVIDMNFTVE